MEDLSLELVSISVKPLITIEPLPFSYELFIPALPIIIPPVGKSGPKTHSLILLSSTFGSFNNKIVASIISVRLCGGMLVAIPTAIPPAPFTNKLGYFAGRTSGSFKELS